MRFIVREDLEQRGIKFSRMHLRRLEASGKFPKHVLLGDNTMAWVDEEIDAWIAQRLAERDNPPPRRRRGRHLNRHVRAPATTITR